MTISLSKYPTIKILETIGRRILVIGDVHGCYTELRQLWNKITPLSNDTIIFLGDLTDRGPDSLGVIEFVYDQHILFSDTHTILSNHEEAHLRYESHVQNGGPNPMNKNDAFKTIHKDISLKHFYWMQTFPAIIKWKDWIFTHAGFIPGVEDRQPLKGFLRNRFVENKDGKWFGVGSWFDDASQQWKHPEGAVHWSSVPRVDTEAKIVYGHEPWPDVHIVNNTFGIDTGCVFGNKLTCMVIDTKTNDYYFVSVHALKQYTK